MQHKFGHRPANRGRDSRDCRDASPRETLWRPSQSDSESLADHPSRGGCASSRTIRVAAVVLRPQLPTHHLQTSSQKWADTGRTERNSCTELVCHRSFQAVAYFSAEITPQRLQVVCRSFGVIYIDYRCLESFPAFLVLSSQSPSGPAGGAPDGYGLGRGAAGPRGLQGLGRSYMSPGPGDAGSTARARAKLHCPHGTGRRRIDRTGPGGAAATLTARAMRRRVDRPGLLRVASQGVPVTILMSAHAPPPGPIRARVWNERINLR